MRIAIDTNILVYAAGIDGVARRVEAVQALARINDEDLVIPLQALDELFVVLLRKGRWTAAAARKEVERWSEGYDLAVTTPDVLHAAMDAATVHRLRFWDSVMLAAAAEAGCDLLLTEDLQDGFAWRGVTVRNPFRPA